MIPLLVHGGRTSAASPPVSSEKEIDAPTLTAKGLSFLGITDALGTSQYDTTNPAQVFAPNVGGRNRQDGGIADRWNIGTYHGHKCVRTTFRAGQTGYLRFNSLYLPNGGGFDEFGFRTRVYVPSEAEEFELLNSSGGKIDGKTMFGITCGRPDCYNPNPTDPKIEAWRWRDGGRDHVAWPDEQHGCGLGLNMVYRENNTFEFTTYLHAIGGRQNGTSNVHATRANLYSHLWAISGWQTGTDYWFDGKGKPLPRGQWFLLELYGKVDTNALNGEFISYVNGEQWAFAKGLDLGGWQGDRRSLSGGFPQQGDGSGDLWIPGGGTGGGWKFRAIFCIDMLGGAYDDAHKPRKTAYYYARDWAAYAGGQQQDTVPQSVLDDDPGTWTTVFDDTFENGFNYNNWSIAGEAHPVTGVNWSDLYPNGTYMTDWEPTNVYVADGRLHLRVTGSGTTWHGGMVHQFKMNGRGWKYGYFEVKFKPPAATQNGFTAPFWLLPQYPRQYWSGGGVEPNASGVPWPDSGEIDVVEQFMVNLPDEAEIAYTTVICKLNDVLTYLYPDNYRVIGTPLEDDWHTIGLHWFEDASNSNKITLKFLHNGVEYSRLTQDDWGGQYSSTAPFDQPFYILIGIHGGTGYGGVDAGNGAGFPPDSWSGKEILVDRVRLFQRS